AAACGGLRSAPDHRTRRALLHLSYSCAPQITHTTLVTHDPNTEPDPALLGHLGLALGHPALDLHGASNGVHDTRKFRQEAVAGVLDDAAAMFGDFRIDQLPEMRFEARVRTFLVYSHQAGVSGDISGENGC